jgi:hypothetical protein
MNWSKQGHPTHFLLKPKHRALRLSGHKERPQVMTFWRGGWTGLEVPRGRVHDNEKKREPVSFGWVLVCLCQTRVPANPDPLVTSRPKNGYGVR